MYALAVCLHKQCRCSRLAATAQGSSNGQGSSTSITQSPLSNAQQYYTDGITDSGDWVMTLSATEVPRFLQYKGSTLHPIISVKIAFKTRDPKTRLWSASSLYEDLWYHDGQPIGCRRDRDLSNIDGLYGDVFVLESDVAEYETRALMNAVVRIMLDLSLRNAMITNLVIPADLYNQCTSDLGHFGFYESQTGSARDTMVLLHVVATPPAHIRKYFRFRSKQAPDS